MFNWETTKSSFFLKILFLTALIFLVIIIQSLVRETYKKNRISREIEKLEKQAQELDRENLEVKERLAYLESEEYKKKEAKDKLGLNNPGEFVVFVKPRVSQENNFAGKETSLIKSATSENLSVSNPLKWWRYFFK